MGWRRPKSNSGLTVLRPVANSVTSLGRNPGSEIELLRTAVVFSYALSHALAASGDEVVSLIAVANGIVYFAWQVALSSKSRRPLHWMRSHFLLNYDFKSRRVRPFSMILSEFSHADKAHLAANMGTLWAFGPEAVSILGHKGFARLYSGGALASAVSSCLWPTMAPKFGIQEARCGTCLGASGALSAVVTYVCMHNSKSVVAIPSPSWLQLLCGWSDAREIKLPLGVAGLLWLATDLWGLFKLNIFFNLNDTGAPKIGYSAHVGGALFGVFFYAVSSLQLFRRALSIPQGFLSIVTAIPRWMFNLRRPRKQRTEPPFRVFALLLLLTYWKWPLAFHSPIYYLTGK